MTNALKMTMKFIHAVHVNKQEMHKIYVKYVNM